MQRIEALHKLRQKRHDKTTSIRSEGETRWYRARALDIEGDLDGALVHL